MEVFFSNIDEPSRHILSEISQTWNDRLESRLGEASGKLPKKLETGAGEETGQQIQNFN